MRLQGLNKVRDEWPSEPDYDLVGIGFGPANLALAITIEEQSELAQDEPVRALFLERQERFAWHPDMLIDGTRIQLSFLKDLVTLRNPRSRYTFLSYLEEKGRLSYFMNLRQFFPTRIEFNDYYAWAAKRLDGFARYGRQVEGVRPVSGRDGRVELLEVVSRNRSSGQTERVLTRNLVVATGGVPSVPAGVEPRPGGPVVHSKGFLSDVRRRCPDRLRDYRFLIVGSGQSAAEIFQYLSREYPNARVTAALRRYAYKPADESHFVNEIFDPATVDFLFSLPETERSGLIREHYDTNYSAVDRELIQEIYDDLYNRRAAGDDRLEVRPLLELLSTEEVDGAAVAHFRDRGTGENETLNADLMVLATGYVRRQRHPLLESLEPYLVADDHGGFEIGRSYRIHSRPEFEPRIYLQGFCEDTHGLADTLLSVLPIRTLEIYRSMLRPSPRLAETMAR